MFCSKCGTQVSDDANFCFSCGANLTAQREAFQKAPVNTEAKLSDAESSMSNVTNGKKMSSPRRKRDFQSDIDEDILDIFESSTDDIVDEEISLEEEYSAKLQNGERLLLEYRVDEAAVEFGELAELGVSRAMLLQAICYEHGLGEKEDTAKAEVLYKKALQAGQELAKVKLASPQEIPQAVDSYLQYLEKEKLTKCFITNFILGDTLMSLSEEEGKYEEKAISYLTKAAEAGFWYAMYLVGNYYKYRKVEPYEAQRWLAKADEIGYAPASFELGDYYANSNHSGNNEEKIFNCYYKAAKRGHAMAQNRVGICYASGQGVEKDPEEAKVWYEQSAEQGIGWAALNLATWYEDHQDIENYDGLAFEWCQKAMDLGVPDACCKLANYYCYAFGVDQDLFIAYNLYNKALKYEQSRGEAEYELCEFYRNGLVVERNEDKAFEYCEAAVNHGYNDAKVLLGLFYENGYGTEIDYQKAFELYQEGSMAGNSTAQYYLAICFEEGKGCPKNFIEAFNYCKIAADNGEIEAWDTLGQYYEKGIGTDVNNQKAMDCYRKAAELGVESAYYHLAVAFSNGSITRQDKSLAFGWMLKAAQKDNPEAICCIGDYYANGIGTDVNRREAVNWYQKAANLGDAMSKYRLALAYDNNWTPIAANDIDVFRLYSEAAEAGITAAKTKLGYMYLNGKGVANSNAKAFKYFEKAGSEGNVDAMVALVYCFLRGIGTKKNLNEAKRWLGYTAQYGYTGVEKLRYEIIEDEVYDAVEAHINNLSERVYVGEEISQAKLMNAINTYGQNLSEQSKENIILLYDMSADGTARHGFIMSVDEISFSESWMLPFEAITKVSRVHNKVYASFEGSDGLELLFTAINDSDATYIVSLFTKLARINRQ